MKMWLFGEILMFVCLYRLCGHMVWYRTGLARNMAIGRESPKTIESFKNFVKTGRYPKSSDTGLYKSGISIAGSKVMNASIENDLVKVTYNCWDKKVKVTHKKMSPRKAILLLTVLLWLILSIISTYIGFMMGLMTFII